MPHFIIECSENITDDYDANQIMQEVFDTAFATGLFDIGDIKVRIKSYNEFILAKDKNDFIHVFGNIMQGRTDEQKKNLSNRIVRKLKELLPNVSIISMNLRDFEKASYCNKGMV
jgi:5-carboxymethyl-2-hydroxymuconate isomerase